MVYGRSPGTTVEPRRGHGEGPTPYSAYAAIDELHALRRPRTGEPAEVSFIVATQVMELLFGLLRHEWTLAQDALRADDLDAATAALRRGLHVQDVLVSSWDLLATLTPREFESFRDALGEASGVQSAAYRRLEFLLGAKSAAMVCPHAGAPEAHRAPSLYDDVLALLRRRGLPVPAGDQDRDAAYRPSPEVEKVWRLVYDGHPDLARLAELLLDVAERVTQWRQRHYTAVRRAMGAKPGTGGSSGLSWLRTAVDQDVFPELWTVRNDL